MSTYYDFYLVKNVGDKDSPKYAFAGAFYKIDGEYKCKPLFSRSQSFICDMSDVFDTPLNVSQMADDVLKVASVQGFGENSTRYSAGYIASLSDVHWAASSQPTRGYIHVDDYNERALSGDPAESPYVYNGDYYAGLPDSEKKKYAYISFVNTGSPEYVCNCISEAIDAAELTYDEAKDYKILMTVG